MKRQYSLTCWLDVGINLYTDLLVFETPQKNEKKGGKEEKRDDCVEFITYVPFQTPFQFS